MRAKFVLCIYLLLALLLSGNTGWSQQPKYDEIFSKDWQKALSFIEENDYWIRDKLRKYDVPYSLAVAVIFPELVRYSALRDKMEITILKALYINLGDEYADFSIGPFQIKPSFAEMICDKAPANMGRKFKNLLKSKSEFPDIESFRSSIVAGLEKPETEFYYIITFFKICEKKFSDQWEMKDEKEKIVFFATAYNAGFEMSAAEISKKTGRKFFNTNPFKTDNYSYSDVSLYWYNQYINAK